MTVPPGLDDRGVEDRLRRILAPLDRHLEWGSTFLAGALVGVVPATFLCLWLLTDTGAKKALGWAAGAFGLVIVVGIAWDAFASRLALWRFEAAFPLGGSGRDLALRVLAEMETPSKAEDRLREMLARSSGRRVRRHRSPLLTLPPADAVPHIDPVPPGQVPRAAGEEPPGRAGYYDYIPLEPKKAQERPPLGQG